MDGLFKILVVAWGGIEHKSRSRFQTGFSKFAAEVTASTFDRYQERDQKPKTTCEKFSRAPDRPAERLNSQSN